MGGAGPTGGYHATAELYDEKTGLFTQTGAMSQVRADHTATLLPSGKVLVVGGKDQNQVPQGSSELYDPSSGTWSAGPNLGAARYGHTATLLSSGKILVAGGYGSSGPIKTAELYDPASGSAGSFSGVSSMATARARQIATLLPNGKVLVAGGVGQSGSLASAELFDPSSNSFSSTGSMATARTWPAASLLPSGDVLVTGGDTNGVGLFSAELYHPQTGSFVAAPSMTVQRVHHNSILLPNGKVLVVGGPFSAVADVFDPVSAPGAATATGSMTGARRYATATLLPSGKVLVTGGETSAGPVATAELYDPATRTFAATGSMSKPRSQHTATLLATGKVLIAGGKSTGGVQISDAELYDPSSGTFTATGPMTAPRMAHTATLLPTGEVLMVGGVTSGTGILASAELYDPAAGTFKATGKMSQQRFGHTATLLPSGKVMIAGGVPASATCEVYDPAAGTFSSVGALARTRYQHTATLLPSGKVLIVGGLDGTTPLASAELYDPATGGFAQTGSMLAARSGHSATIMPSGQVLIAGGQGAAQLASIEVFDPGDGTNGGFTSGGNLTQARTNQVASLLPDGTVLIAGGFASGNPLSSADTWDAGQVGNAAWRPQLSTAPASAIAGQGSNITGSRLLGVSQAGDGSTQASPTNYPVAVWMPTQGGWGTVGSITAWSATGATWTPPPTALSGPGWLFAVANGIPSNAKPSTVRSANISAPCVVGAQCATGFCVDGVCCDSACDQSCEACSAALKGSGADGVCGPVAQGTDPKDQCPVAPQATCGTTGECDGAGACSVYASGTVCFAASCSGPVLSPEFKCDGSGKCVASTPQDCSPNLCVTSSGSPACGTTCTAKLDCAPSSFCKQGVCTKLESPGEACTANSECLGAHCVDGVCCNSACDGTCAACSQAKTGIPDGLCAPVKAGTDPNSDCDAQPGTCGFDGECNGAYSCEYFDKSTQCGKPSCIDAADHSTEYKQFCDGKGNCSEPVPSDCGAYKCSSTTKTCRTSCAADSECAPLYRCDSTKHACVNRGQGICLPGDIQETPDGKQTNCAPFGCDPSNGICRTSCQNGAECSQGNVCNSQGQCVAPFPASQPGGCGCTVPGGHSPRRGELWLLVVLGLALAGSRRCSRRPESEPER